MRKRVLQVRIFVIYLTTILIFKIAIFIFKKIMLSYFINIHKGEVKMNKSTYYEKGTKTEATKFK